MSENDRLICFCFNVRESEIIAAIQAENPKTVPDLTDVCKAGNGCTSCWMDLEDLLAQHGGD